MNLTIISRKRVKKDNKEETTKNKTEKLMIRPQRDNQSFKTNKKDTVK